MLPSVELQRMRAKFVMIEGGSHLEKEEVTSVSCTTMCRMARPLLSRGHSGERLPRAMKFLLGFFGLQR